MEEGAWDDFANNLATDLAPLITLFGEQVTKQYLSESVGFLDTLVFALAPLGILTAVVSAIRISGSPSLRAFIGRSQEGPGNAEIELLSCTSETTAELWNDGGISRVFGKPMLLEVVVENDDPKTHDPTINFVYAAENSWEEKKAHTRFTSNTVIDEFMKSSPNLSLNKGIKRRPQVWFYGAAALGVCLVLGVLIFGAITVYLIPSTFQRDGKPVGRYSYPCFFVGTITVDCGMFLCARIIERATLERFYSPKDDKRGDIFWLQPGGQKVGDQVFNAFVGRLAGIADKSSGRGYVKSIKNPRVPRALTLWFAVSITLTGFILQFVGARGLHASVTLAWLGSTLLMACVRASLRASRMVEADNLIGREPKTLAYGFELDWFSIYLRDESAHRGFHLITNPTQRAALENTPKQIWKSNTNFGSKVLKTRTRLAVLTGPQHLAWEAFPVRNTAQQLKIAIESIMELLRSVPNKHNAKTSIKWPIYIDRSGPDSNNSDRVVEEHIIFITRRNIYTKWQVEQSELEAMLGLWTWSLVEHRYYYRRVEGEIQSRILCSGSFDKELGYPEIAQWFPTTDLFWIVQMKPADPTKSFVFHDLQNLSQMSLGQTIPSALRNSTFDLCVETKNSTLQLAAHDIFTSFLSIALSKGLDATFNKAFDDATHISLNPSLGIGSYRSHLVGNHLIEGWVDKFEESNLGSREDALLCIMPIVYERPNLSRLHGALKLVRQQLEVFKMQKNFPEVRRMLGFIAFSFERSRLDRHAHRRTLVEAIEILGSYHVMPTDPLIDINFTPDNKFQAEFQSLVDLVGKKFFRFLTKCDWDRVDAGIFSCSGGKTTESTSDLSVLERLFVATESRREGDVSPDLLESLSWAIENQQRLLFLLLLDNGRAIENKSVEGMTYLMRASEMGNLDMVDWLLAEGADIDALSSTFQTALIIAADNMHWEVMESLVLRGADLSARKHKGDTALRIAERHDKLSIIKKLLDRGAGLEAGFYTSPMSFIHAARYPGNEEVIADMLKSGASVNAKDWNGWTALMHVAQRGSIKAIEVLMNNNADYKMENRDGQTALKIAEEWHQYEASKLIKNWAARHPPRT